MVETQVAKTQSPEEKASDFLVQLGKIGEAADVLQGEIEQLLTKKLDPNTDAGKLVKTLQRLQRVLKVDLTNLEITVREQGGFRPWAESLLRRRG